jgi:hypothetical protein
MKLTPFKLDITMFSEHTSLIISIAMLNESNFNKFIDSEDEGTFIKVAVNENIVSNIDILCNEQMHKFIEYFNENFNDIISKIMDKDIKAKTIYNSNSHDMQLRIILKLIELKMDYEMLCDTTLNEAVEQLYDFVWGEATFIYFLLALYLEAHLSCIGIKLTRQKRFRRIVEAYIIYSNFRFSTYEMVSGNVEKESQIEVLQKDNKNKDKVIEEKKKKINTVNKKHVEELKKLKSGIELLEKNHKTLLSAKGDEILELRRTLKDLKLNSNGSHKKADGKSNELSNLHKSIHKLSIDNTKLQVEIDRISAVSIYDRLSKYLDTQGLDERLKDLIDLHYKAPLQSEDYVEEAAPALSMKEQMGVCEIIEGEHYFRDLSNGLNQIISIPEESYIPNNSFVKVDSKYNYIHGYSYQFVSKRLRDKIDEFVSLIVEGDKLFAQRGDGKIVKLSNPQRYSLRNKNFVAINKNNEILTFYKRTPFVIDYYLESISAKNHSAYLILKVVDNGVVVRDIINENEEFIKIDSESLNQYEIIFMNSNEIINSLDNPSFYTRSSKYENAKLGQTRIINNRVYVEKSNSEIVLLRRILYNSVLEEGQLVRYDEFNCFINIEKCTEELSSSDEMKILSYRSNNKEVTDVSERQHIKCEKGKILVVGNTKLQNSYIRVLSSEGYQSEVVDGYAPFDKILKAANSNEMIVVVTEHASHKNYFMLKDKYQGKVVYTHKGGSNRILDVIQENIDVLP